jgi:hypothetical protein
MTPSRCNKAGVRYRYCVSHALLRRRKDEAGGVARVPTVQVEAIVVEESGITSSIGPAEGHGDRSDREVIDRHVQHVAVSLESIDVRSCISRTTSEFLSPTPATRSSSQSPMPALGSSILHLSRWVISFGEIAQREGRWDDTFASWRRSPSPRPPWSRPSSPGTLQTISP